MRSASCVLKLKIIKKNVLIGYIGHHYFAVIKVKIMSMGHAHTNTSSNGGLHQVSTSCNPNMAQHFYKLYYTCTFLRVLLHVVTKLIHPNNHCENFYSCVMPRGILLCLLPCEGPSLMNPRYPPPPRPREVISMRRCWDWNFRLSVYKLVHPPRENGMICWQRRENQRKEPVEPRNKKIRNNFMRPVNTSANLERNDALSQRVNKLSLAIGT